MQALLEKAAKINKRVVKEVGVLEGSARLEDYISRLIFGRCYVSKNGDCCCFVLPEDKTKLVNYLHSQTVAPGNELLVDLSPVVICLLVDKERMYSLSGAW
jgi:hypothetical protein